MVMKIHVMIIGFQSHVTQIFQSLATSHENVSLKTTAMIYVANTSMEMLVYARIQVPVRTC